MYGYKEILARENEFEREIALLENKIERSQKSIALYKRFLEEGIRDKEIEKEFGQYVRHNWSMSYEEIMEKIS